MLKLRSGTLETPHPENSFVLIWNPKKIKPKHTLNPKKPSVQAANLKPSHCEKSSIAIFSPKNPQNPSVGSGSPKSSKPCHPLPFKNLGGEMEP
jgi:hypothetical protein